jgi:glycosyltransferase involved in cell wall biosynthesis
MRRKKVIWHTNSYRNHTGFGRNSKALLKKLHETGKYEIVEYCTSTSKDDPSLLTRPWKAYGTIPPQREFAEMQKDPFMARSVAYGAKYIDEIIKAEEPDIYVGIEDIWAFNGWWHKPWWNKISSVIHTTIDSLPIIGMAKEAAKKTKEFYVWAKFAEREMETLGNGHVKNLHGTFDTDNFFKLPSERKLEIRRENGIVDGAFVIGFVFRNQLRKSVPQLLDGFSKFLKKAPNAYLYLHTCWSEAPNSSWDIPTLIKNFGIDPAKVLTTYVCSKCGTYYIRPFCGERLDCPTCQSKESVNTASSVAGVSEQDLNEIYNVFDVLAHPFTSGGQEIPIQEAKLVELITLVTNYSCGDEYCLPSNGGIPLEWEAYQEPGSLFVKATTSANDIAKKLEMVYRMSDSEKEKMGKKARKFVIDNFDTKYIAKKWEEILDRQPFVINEKSYKKEEWEGVDHKVWDFKFEKELKNPNYSPSSEPDNVKWLKELYLNILKIDLSDDDTGLNDWLKGLEKGKSREDIFKFFKNQAIKDNASSVVTSLESLLDEDDFGRRIGIVMPESAGDVLMASSLLPNMKKTYPDHNIYFITKPPFVEVIEGNPFVHKVLPYFDGCENLLAMEGCGSHKGYFDIMFLPHVGTQRVLDYTHNGNDSIQFDIKDF